jgi:hypothetical protein
MKDKSNTLFHINPYVLERLEDYLQSMPDGYREELLYHTSLDLNEVSEDWNDYIRDDGRIRLKKRTNGWEGAMAKKQGGLIPLLFFFGAWKRNPEYGGVDGELEVVDWLRDCLSDIYDNSPYWKGMRTNQMNMEWDNLIKDQVGSRGMGHLVYNGTYDKLIGSNYMLNPFKRRNKSLSYIKPYIDATDVIEGYDELRRFWATLDQCIPVFFLTPQHHYKPFLNYSEESFKTLKV